MLASSSATAATTTFTRYDWDGNNPVSIDSPPILTVDAFDWANDDTIIYAIYTSGDRNRLYLADVVADPFAVNTNTAWNADGYITTSVTTRIRNVRRGDVYSGYAYYGDAGQATNPKFYVLNLATGVETLLGNLAGTLTGATTSFGLWTVVERDGYLYLQTSDNGICVYRMTDATTLGSLYTTYTKEQLDALMGGSAQYYGFDVTADGRRLLLGGQGGNVFELGERPSLSISRSGAAIVISWPASVSAQVIQSSASLSQGGVSGPPLRLAQEAKGKRGCGLLQAGGMQGGCRGQAGY